MWKPRYKKNEKFEQQLQKAHADPDDPWELHIHSLEDTRCIVALSTLNHFRQKYGTGDDRCITSAHSTMNAPTPRSRAHSIAHLDSQQKN